MTSDELVRYYPRPRSGMPRGTLNFRGGMRQRGRNTNAGIFGHFERQRILSQNQEFGNPRKLRFTEITFQNDAAL